ncbi:MAG: BREX system ATP-binding domain-containing protein [Planctomycetaceae bacterium]
MLDSLDPRMAHRIIHSLAESGQPPKFGASFLNVGTDRIIQGLRSDYLEGLLTPFDGQDGQGTCKWVEANYGNGKTQFLRCVQEVAWSRNFVTAFVELSQDECPLDRMDRVYGAIARSLQAPPLVLADIDRGRGIEVAFQQLLDRKFEGVLSGTPNDELKAQAIEWVESSLASTPTESTGYRHAAVRHLLAKLRGEGDAAMLTAAFLRGEPCPAKELKTLGVHEKLDKASGMRFLRSLCQLLQRSELATGTVLLFDEARRSLSLMSNKSKAIACENLLTIINKCNSGDLPGTLFLYAVMPVFFTDFADVYPALQQRCMPATRINLEALQINEEELLRQMGRRITDVFRIAHPDAPGDDKVLARSLQRVANLAQKRTMVGTGTRRLLVGTWVRALQEFRNDGVKPLADEDIERLMESTRKELDATEEAQVAAEGE